MPCAIFGIMAEIAAPQQAPGERVEGDDYCAITGYCGLQLLGPCPFASYSISDSVEPIVEQVIIDRVRDSGAGAISVFIGTTRDTFEGM